MNADQKTKTYSSSRFGSIVSQCVIPDTKEERIKNLNKLVRNLAKELDLSNLSEELKANVDESLESYYNDRVREHESYINSLKERIKDSESDFDKIKILGGVAGRDLLDSLNESKNRLVIAKNIKEKELK